MKRKVLAVMLLWTLLVSWGSCAGADSLTELTSAYGFRMGAALSYQQMKDTAYLELIKKHFASVTMTNEMKAYSLLDQRKSQAASDGMPQMNYSMADAMVSWAQEAGLLVRGHVLVWDAYMLDWFFHEDYDEKKPYADADTIAKRTESYITDVIEHFERKFPGVVYCWDVVNEAVGDGGDYNATDARHLRMTRNGTSNLFYQYMGDDYVEKSFLYARNAAEKLGADIKLYYNDYNAYFSEKATAIHALVQSVNTYTTNADGTPRKLCDGVGMQGYIGGYGTQSGCLEESHLAMIRQAIENYASDGLEVQITEMAVRNFELNQVERHAQYYGELFEVFKELWQAETAVTPLKVVTIWGLLDDPAAPKGSYVYNLNSPYGGLFTEKLEEKDAFKNVIQVLSENTP